jgi:hypothetical protein
MAPVKSRAINIIWSNLSKVKQNILKFWLSKPENPGF